MSEQADGGQDDRDREKSRNNGSGNRASSGPSGGSGSSGGSGTSTGSGSSGASRPGQAGRQSRSRQSNPGTEMLSDFQRWLIRSSAKNMRKEISGQVRRTFGGGRNDNGDVWDTATTEIPPEVGESPECQWCPVCRAARAMRESSPGLSGHLSTAGDVVASAVQEAFKAFDSVVNRSGGSAGSRTGDRASWDVDPASWTAARDEWAVRHGARTAAHGASEHAAPDASAPDASAPDASAPEASAGEPSAPDHNQSAESAQGMTDEPDGMDEPHNRG
jgi:hypothetical protein